MECGNDVQSGGGGSDLLTNFDKQRSSMYSFDFLVAMKEKMHWTRLSQKFLSEKKGTLFAASSRRLLRAAAAVVHVNKNVGGVLFQLSDSDFEILWFSTKTQRPANRPSRREARDVFFCSLTDETEESSPAPVLVKPGPFCLSVFSLIPLFSLCEGDHEVDQTS